MATLEKIKATIAKPPSHSDKQVAAWIAEAIAKMRSDLIALLRSLDDGGKR